MTIWYPFSQEYRSGPAISPSRGPMLPRDPVSMLPIGQPIPRDIPYASSAGPPSASSGYPVYGSVEAHARPGPTQGYSDWESGAADTMMRDTDSQHSLESHEYPGDAPRRHGGERSRVIKHHSQRRPSNRDEFDGPHQLLSPPSPRTIASQEQDLPHLPTNLDVQEQDKILCQVNDRLSQCAFDFVAKYQFPIPVESDKRPVRVPADREWTEWVFLLKRLATKRRIPARVLYNNQIKQLVTVLENSLEMRHAAKHQSRPLKDDRNVLQLISAGTQVAKILKDAAAMDFLDHLYGRTEMLIQDRRTRRGFAMGV